MTYQPENILKLTEAAGAEVEPIWASLLAKALAGKDLKDLLSNIGAGGPAAGVSAGGAGEESKDEEDEEEDEDEDEEDDDDSDGPVREVLPSLLGLDSESFSRRSSICSVNLSCVCLLSCSANFVPCILWFAEPHATSAHRAVHNTSLSYTQKYV